jgi:hypothetical protein
VTRGKKRADKFREVPTATGGESVETGFGDSELLFYTAGPVGFVLLYTVKE